MPKMKLFGEPGWGSAIVEAQLDWYGIEFDFERDTIRRLGMPEYHRHSSSAGSA